MPESGLDPRVRRTRGLIVSKYLEAISTSSKPALTVSGLCASAGVSRSVFYRHFEGLADLEARGLGLFLGGLLEEAGLEGGSDRLPPGRSVQERVTRFFAILERHRPTLLPLLKRSPRLGADLRDAVEAWLGEYRVDRVPDAALRVPRRYIAPVLASSLLAFCVEWLEDPRGEGPRSAAAAFLEISTRGLFGFGP